MKEPKIRFKEFKGEWEETTFGESVIINSGLNYKHLSDGDIPVYGTGGYMLSVNQSLSEVDAIGIGRKGTIDKPQFLKAPFWTVDTLFFMTPKKGLDLHFLFALSQKTNWRKFDESTGVPSLSKINICKIDIFTPKISEQQSIASFFTSIDAQISASTSRLASLKQIKAASLQVMFPQEGETVPKLRFKGFDGEWERKRLNQFLIPSSTKNTDGKYNKKDVLSVSGEFGIVNQITFQGRSFAGVSVANYGVVEHDNIVYTKSPLKTNPYGIIKVNKGKAGIVSTLYAVYNCLEGTYPCFVEYYFGLDNRLNSYLRPLVRKGAKNDMKISSNDALLGEVVFPSFAEQRAIASYFTNLDRQITLQARRLEKLKQIKAACLDKMFV